MIGTDINHSPKALIFDVDGTLAETEELHRQAFNQIFTEAGLNWQWDEPTYLRLLAVTGGKERMRAWREEVGFGPDDATIAALHMAKTERYGQLMAEGRVTLRMGVADLVHYWLAAGRRLAIATTTSRANVEALCQATFGTTATAVFPIIAAGDEVAQKKPAPDVYDLALERLGLEPHDAIAIEDSRNGIRAARSADLRVLVTPSRYTQHEDLSGATWRASDLRRENLPDCMKVDAHV